VSGIDLVDVVFGSALLDAVRSLGDANRRWTGFLPSAAWSDYAQRGTILAAVAVTEQANTAELLGYAAYRLPRDEVVLAHLVVAQNARGNGIARLLVDELCTRYADRRGIRARCRRDWPAHHMWPRLGFIAQHDRPGRSARRDLLTTWWLDHGHPDLLTWTAGPSSGLAVVLDCNVFLDLHGDSVERSHHEIAESTRQLLQETLGGRIQLLVTPEIHNEIDRSAEASRRAALHATADSYPRLRVDRDVVDVVFAAIVDELPSQPTRPQARSDILHIAYAAAAGIGVLVTRDEPALKQLAGPALAVADVRLISPHELVLLVDELEDSAAYRPAALLGTGYGVAELGVGLGEEIRRAFLDTAGGERRRQFDTTMRDLASRRPVSHQIVYRDPGGEAAALLGCHPDGAALDVPLLRVRPGPLAGTLATQIVAGLRVLAAEQHLNRIRISDPQLSDAVRLAAAADGFDAAGADPVGVTVPALLPIAALPAALKRACAGMTQADAAAVATLKQAAESLATAVGAEAAAAMEHRLRPLRLLDADIPTWLVPIKPVWSSQLFGVPRQLFDRPDHLGISIEHVYYRFPRSAGEQVPGRVLWYATAPEKAVIACSTLLEVTQGACDELWRRYRRLGVYTRDDVHKTGQHTGQVRALRVSDTEVFEPGVPLERLRALAEQHGHRLLLRSATAIDAKLFAAVLREARGDS
jgi:predicted nucleic acid-binding protein/predicted transcriptional regulator/GNAT superfamily N-acetyltransferase